MVAGLVPWVGEQHVEAVDPWCHGGLRQGFGGIVRAHFQVDHTSLVGAVQETADTGAVHLEAQKIAFGVLLAGREQVFAVAEADLQGEWRGALE